MPHPNLVRYLVEHREKLPAEHAGKQFSSLAPAVLHEIFQQLPAPTQRAYRAKLAPQFDDRPSHIMEGGKPRSDV